MRKVNSKSNLSSSTNYPLYFRLDSYKTEACKSASVQGGDAYPIMQLLHLEI